VMPGLLRELYVGRRTGVLHFRQDDQHLRVRFRRGNVVRAASSAVEERLGESLVRQGLLSPADLARAKERVDRDGVRMGAALLRLGIFDQGQLEDTLAAHVKEILLRLFGWGDGDYAFEDVTEEEDADDVTLKLSTGDMILEAVRRVEDPDVVRYGLGNLDRVLVHSSDPLLRFQQITLSPTDGFLLSRVDGLLSAREVVDLCPPPREEIQRSLLGLLSTGLIEYLPAEGERPPVRVASAPSRSAPAQPQATPSPSPPVPEAPRAVPVAPPEPPPPPPKLVPPVSTDAGAPSETRAAQPTDEADERRKEILDAYEGLNGRNHFEVLGIPRTSNDAQVKEAYFRLARRFHPDVHHNPALEDMHDKLEAVFIRVGEAYEQLRNPRRRAEYEARLPRTPPPGSQAPVPRTGAAPGAAPAAPAVNPAEFVEAALRDATAHMKAGRFWDAIQVLETALPRAEGRAAARVRLLLGQALLKNPNWVKRGEELLREVLRDDPNNVEAYMLLGDLYESSQLRGRALTMYRRVLAIQPDHPAAASRVAALGTPEADDAGAASGGRLLKKLFKKG